MAKKIKRSQVAVSPTVSDIDPVLAPVYEKGSERPFVVTTPPAQLVDLRKITPKEYIYLAVLVAVGLYVRFFNLSYPNSVVFDEVHFGNFASKYIKGTFFMDVHPPLVKMLFASIAMLGGFNGDFNFAGIGTQYPENVPYLIMRAFPALCGIAIVVLCYLTLRASGCRPLVCFFTASCLLFENANVTISKFILLDSPLLFFIAGAVYCQKKLELEQPFTRNWFKLLISTGICLGLSVSSKWVGLFTIAWVGLATIYQLWFIIGDVKIPAKKVVQHFIYRGVILLGVPILLYIGVFAVHFSVLAKEGDGGAFMSSAFRSTLINNKIPTNILADVGVGSEITIRHAATQGGYLHSHDHLYETGSKQQQITLYPHLDLNNNWIVELYNVSDPPTDFEPIKDGTKIRLLHKNTFRRLHSHDEKAPVSEQDWQKEASAYGYQGFGGDANDDFVVEIVKSACKSELSKTNVRAIETVFRLRHAMSGCYLFSSETKLPKWGFEQQEVTCATQGKREKSQWYIETNVNPYLPPNSEIINYRKPGVIGKIIESHQKMWKINQGLTEHHSWQSQPQDWPFLLRGINYWVKDNKQVYFFGNPVVWWSTTVTVVGFAIYLLVSVLRWQRNVKIASDPHVYNFNQQTFLYIAGWATHYLPFFIMGRQLFLHHYLPSLYFGILALGHVFDLLASYVFAKKRIISYVFIGSFFLTSFVVYVHYSSLIYATPWTKQQCTDSQLLGGWDFACNSFHDSLGSYSVDLSQPVKTNAPQSVDFKQAIPVIQMEESKEADKTPEKVYVPEANTQVFEESAKPAAQEEEPVVEEIKEEPVHAEPVQEQQPIVQEVPIQKEEPIAEPIAEPVPVAEPVAEQQPIVQEESVPEPVAQEVPVEQFVPEAEQQPIVEEPEQIAPPVAADADSTENKNEAESVIEAEETE